MTTSLQFVYVETSFNGFRRWRVQFDHPAGLVVVGEIDEGLGSFDFFPAENVRFSRYDLLEISGFISKLQERFTREAKTQSKIESRT